MRILQVGELKTRFSEVLERVKAGEEIVISYGRKKENIAVIVPYGSFKKENRIVTGLLSDKQMEVPGDFELTEEELASL
jgi:prevent-host-death family protein